MSARSVPRSVRLLVWTVAAGGAGAMALRLPDLAAWRAGDLLFAAGLGVVVAALERFPVTIRHRGEGENFSLTEAAIFAGFLLTGPGVVAAAVVVGVLAGHSLARRAPHKVAFNVGQFALAVAAADAVRSALGVAGPGAAGAEVAGTIGGMAAFMLVNVALVAAAVSLASGERFRTVLLDPSGMNLLHWAVNLAVGGLGVVVWAAEPLLVPLMAGPLLGSSLVYRALLQERTRLSEVVAHSSDGIVAVGADGTIRSWNEAMERMVGIPAPRAVGRPFAEVLGRALEPSAGATQAPDILFVREDGTGRWLRYHLLDGLDVGSDRVAVVRDMTAEVEAEQAKAQFVDTVSHELRTPLTPLKGYLGALSAGTVGATEVERQECYQAMARQVSRLEGLVEDLLDVASSDPNGRGPMVGGGSSVDLAELVRHEIARERATDAGTPIELVLPEGPVIVRADPDRVRRVLGGLVSNARKFSPPGRPVHVLVEMDAGRGVVSVRDHGPGVAASERERIFQRFQRGDGGLTRTTGGVGVGLFVAKRLVESMLGSIWVEPAAGGGARFSFSVPVDLEVRTPHSVLA